MKLTPEQIKNWREVLCLSIGPYAFIMSDSEVQAVRDRYQAAANRLGDTEGLDLQNRVESQPTETKREEPPKMTAMQAAFNRAMK